MGALMRAYDWSHSPLGLPDSWPGVLKASVATCLASRFPKAVWWGPDLIMFYNDAWKPILGDTKHPAVLAQPAAQSWPETWPIAGSQFEDALNGNASWFEDSLLAIDRHGFLEECYLTYSNSPLRGCDGRVVGVMTAGIETTGRVIGDRRMRVLRDLSKATVEVASQGKSINEICEYLLGLVCQSNPDVPFAAPYLLEENGRARLICAAGIDRVLLPPLASTAIHDCWGISGALNDQQPVLVGQLQTQERLPCSCWPEPTRQVLALPLASRGTGGEILGVILVGLNSRLQLDERYLDFLKLVAAEFAACIDAFRSIEKEKRDLAALARLTETSSRLWRKSDLQEGLSELLDGAIDLLSADMGTIHLLDEKRGVLHLAAHKGLADDILDFFREVQAKASSVCGRAVLAGSRVIIEDTEIDEAFAPFRHVSRGAGYRSAQATPIIGRAGLPLGVLSTRFRAVHRLSAQSLRHLDLYVRQVGDFIERCYSDNALVESEARFRNMADNAPVIIWVTDPDGTCTFISKSWYEFTGQTPEDGQGFGWLDAIHPDDREVAEREFRTANAEQKAFRLEYRLRRTNGEWRWAIDAAAPRFCSDGTFLGYIGSVLDIHERRTAEEREHLLMREINHRANNLLSVVQVVARRTVEATPEDFLDRLNERIQALGASHDLLVKSAWEAVPLRDLVNSQLAHFGEHDGRISLKGPFIGITAPAAQTLGMALHELATNASKYGALSKTEGRIEVSWDMRPGVQGKDEFVMSWTEKNGPAVPRPTRLGFGSTVIIEMTRLSLEGQVTIDYAPSGVVWRLACPARNVFDGTCVATPAPVGAVNPLSTEESAGRSRVLVVEDEALISMDIASMLSTAGFEVLGPASTVAQAFNLLERSACDAAVLDVNLGKETAEPVARYLLENGTPFITVSGYAREQQPAIFRKSLLLPKPLRSDLLINAVRQCIELA